jgi:hypothetical protein
MKKAIMGLAVMVLVLTSCGPSIPSTDIDVLKKAVEEVKKEENTTDTKTDTSSVSTNVDINECFKGCAMLGTAGAMNKDLCEHSCWVSEAIQKKDISICDTKIPAGDILQFSCKMGLAEETGDVSYCETIADGKDDLMEQGCYMSIAKKLKKPDICESIKGTLLYDSCVEDAK